MIHVKDTSMILYSLHHVFRTSAEIDQFIKGMEDVGNFWTTVQQNSRVFQPMFCFKTEPLTKEKLESLCTIAFSFMGSNNKMKEEETVFGWECFLQDISGKYTNQLRYFVPQVRITGKMLNGYPMFSVKNIVQNVELIELWGKILVPLHFVISKS